MPHLFEVGGKVRDQLIGTRSSDTDFCVVLTPSEARDRTAEEGFSLVRQWILDQGMTIFQESAENFTLRAKSKQSRSGLDFVMAVKREGDTCLPGFLSDDLLARDFTVNAIAKACSDGTLIDPTGGIEDLEDRILRTPIDPMQTLRHDPIRAIRAVRFALKLGLEWSSELKEALHDPELVELMKAEPDDRVLQELRKLFQIDSWGALELIHSLPAALGQNWLGRPGFWLMPTNRQRH